MSNNSRTAAFKELSGFAGMFRNLLALEEELRELGGYDQLIASYKARVVQAEREAVHAEGILADIKLKEDEQNARIDADLAQAQEKIDAAKREAGTILANAEKHMRDAEARAAEMIASAERRVADCAGERESLLSAAKAEAEGIVSSAKRRSVELETEAKSAELRREEADRDTNEARAQLSGLRQEIDKLRARFGAVN